MTKHEWRIGDWCELRSVRYLVFKVVENGTAWAIPECGGFNEIMFDANDKEVKKLDGCDSWTWKPIEPPDGYRLLEAGESRESGDIYFNKSDGTWKYSDAIDSYRSPSITYARKIEPQYRPFKDAAEYIPHRDRWFRWKEVKGTKNESACHRIHSYSDTVVWVGMATTGLHYSEAFERLEFEDETPFGVKV